VAKRKIKSNHTDGAQPTELRIIGGHFRARKLLYHGDPVTRPMKHRVREAIFNLVGIEAKGRHAIDLFAGTGALGLEALSRGAASATFIERHIPTSRIVAENIASLEVEDRTVLLTTSAFLWSKRDLPKLKAESGKPTDAEASALGFPPSALTRPWLVFFSPPYSFFIEKADEMLELIGAIKDQSPAGSTLVVEADERFDFETLPGNVAQDKKSAGWDVRKYHPAFVGVWRT